MTQTAPERAARPERPARPTWSELRRAAVTGRMLGLLALLVVAAVVCVRLGAWQIDRAYANAEASQASQELALELAQAVPLASFLEPGAHVMGADVGVPVTVTGSYDPAHEVLVPGRAVAGEEGYLVVTPLRTTDGAWLAVVRGFLPGTDDGAAPVAPSAPEGVVELLGAVTAGEAYRPQQLPAGQVPSISPAYFAGVWGTPIYNAYLVLAEGEDELVTVPRPALSDEGGANLRNLAYAAEWFVFGAFALVVWYRLVRDEALDLRTRPAPATPAAPPA